MRSSWVPMENQKSNMFDKYEKKRLSAAERKNQIEQVRQLFKRLRKEKSPCQAIYVNFKERKKYWRMIWNGQKWEDG